MTNILPKISIVTPSFNQGKFLEATINSVLDQNYSNLEYIIIDGGSTDNSVDIIKKYENHLYFWSSSQDLGQYDAINKGFSIATGEIMAWLNSDDMYLSWTFRTVADIMANLPQVEWLTTLNTGGWDYHGFCKGFDNVRGYSLEAFLDGCYLIGNQKGKKLNWIQQESTFWRRSIWEKTGSYLDINFDLAGDFELWCRFFLKANLYSTYSPLGGFRSQCNQKSRNIQSYIQQAELALSKMRDTCNWKPNKLRNLLFQMRIDKIPKIKNFFESQLSFEGKRIVRANNDNINGYWKVENYKFY